MKRTTLIVTLILLISCNSAKDKATLEKTDSKTTGINKSSISCPEDGVCTIQLLKNKSLLIKEDEINSIYYQTLDNIDYSIIKYTYTRNKEKGVEDSSYVEEILFEINNSYTELELNNSELASSKMLFGRHCFCKGQAGYFPVNSGKLLVQKKHNIYTLNLKFTLTEIPQIINTIQASVE